jgi:hypothetical protein
MLNFGRGRKKPSEAPKAARGFETTARVAERGVRARGGSRAGNHDNIARVNGLLDRFSRLLSRSSSRAVIVLALAAIPTVPARAAAVPQAWPMAAAWPMTPGLAAVEAPDRAPDAAPAAVVGLDADAPEQGAALTQALRRAFAARGLSGGEEVNLSELRLALGCKSNSPECLARGGPLLGARRLIYGTLRRGKGQVWKLEVALVEVDDGAATTASLSVSTAELAADRIDAIAEEVADRLAPDTAASAVPGRGTGGLASPQSSLAEPVQMPTPADDAEQEAGSGKVRWGWVRPQPRWKWVAFGVSAGITAAGAAATIGMSVWLTSKNGGFRGELVEAATKSLSDSNEVNDVDPNLPAGVNLCDFARSLPTDENGNPLGMPGQVRNTAVVKVCNKGDTVRSAEIGTAVTTAVGAAATVAFTLVLFLHREPTRTSAWRRHRLHVGVDPVRGQGLSLRMGGRF